jgi:hypothetical protein
LELSIYINTYLGEPFPVVLNFNRFRTPLVANYFRDLGIGEPRMAGDDLGLIMLPIENKSCKYKSIVVLETRKKWRNKEVGSHATGPVKKLKG